MALEQADGLWKLEKYTSAGDAGDPYPGSAGNEYFNYFTVPDSRDYYFQDTNVAVGPIPETADTVTIHFSVYETGIEDDIHIHLHCKVCFGWRVFKHEAYSCKIG